MRPSLGEAKTRRGAEGHRISWGWETGAGGICPLHEGVCYGSDRRGARCPSICSRGNPVRGVEVGRAPGAPAGCRQGIAVLMDIPGSHEVGFRSVLREWASGPVNANSTDEPENDPDLIIRAVTLQLVQSLDHVGIKIIAYHLHRGPEFEFDNILCFLIAPCGIGIE